MASPRRVKLARKVHLPEECRTFKELAGQSGLSTATVRRYVIRHRLTVLRGSRKTILIPESVWRDFWRTRQARWHAAYGK